MRTLPFWVKGLIYSFLCIFTLAQTGFGQGPATAPAYGKLPLSFEPNQGQAGSATDFVARGQGYTLLLNPNATTLALHRSRPAGSRDRREEERGALAPSAPPAALQLRLVGANASAEPAPENLLPGKSNYLIGNDRTKWRTNVANYARVRYRSVYPGIDVVYYGNQRLLEHDFEVSPGADPRKIRLAFDGASSVEIAASGDLVLHVADGEVRLQKPVIYQNTEAGRREVTGGFVLRKNQATIQVGAYDRRRALVIDPVLGYSTYLGGNGEDSAQSLAVDGSGNAYLAGYTASTNFPITAGALSTACQNCSGSNDDVFVAKINPTGTALVYSTFISGSNDDEAYSIAVDGSGNAYVTGFTNSSNFPVTPGAFQTTLKSFLGNAFVSVLNSTGTGLIYSTFLGGSARDFGNPIALDGSGNIYVGGESYSTDFPTIGTSISNPPPTFYVSNDGGTSFSASSSGIKSLQLIHVVVDNGTPGTLYVGSIGGGVYKSTNSGATWVQMPTPFDTALNPAQLGGDDALALVMDPTPSLTGSTATLYEGSEFFGVSRTTNGGASWSTINTNLNVGSVLSLAVNPLNTATLYAGTSGEGVWVSNNANSPTPTWSQMSLTGLTTGAMQVINALAVDPVNGTVYAGTNAGVFQFSTAANSWVALTNGITANAFIHDLAVDPSRNLYAATGFSGGIFKFNPTAGSWQAINGSPVTTMTATDVLGITVDPAVPTTLYAATQGGVFRSADGGTNWTLLTTGLVTTDATKIAVDPNNSSKLYFGSFNPMSFVAKFPAGGGLPLLLTQFGGVSGQTFISSIAADSLGNTYVGGATNAALPPPLVGPQTSIAGLPSFDAFISKITPGQTVAYSRYLGGSGSDQVVGLAVDTSFNVYASGITNSTDFPVTPSAFQLSHNAAPGPDAFVVEVDPTGANLLYCSYFGGSGVDQGLNLALLSPGIVAIVGQTDSTDLPTVNAIQPFNAGGYDAFFAKFDLTKSGAASLPYSTYLGGSSFDAATSVGFDSSGNAYVGGYSFSSNFPTTAGVIQGALSTFSPDAVAFKLQSTGNTSDVGITMTSGAGTTAAEGTTYVYTIHVINNGPSTAGAPSVVVSGAMPTNLTVNSVSPGQGTCSGLQTFTCSLGTVALGGAGVDVTVNVTANTVPTPPVGPTMTATATVSTADDDPVPTNNVASTTVTVQRQADLRIIALGAPSSVPNNVAFQYSVTPFNAGLSTATGVIVSYPLPASVTFNQGASSAGCALSAGTVSCPVVNLTPFSSTVIGISVTPSLPGPLTATFTVSSSQVVDDGPNGAPGANNTPPPFTNTVRANVDLSVAAQPISPNVPVGGSAALALTIRNLGTDTATSPSVTTTLPAGMSYGSFSSPNSGVSCSVAGSVLCSLPDLAANASLTVTIFATAVLQGTYTVTSSVSFSGTDTLPSNNNTTAIVTFTGAPNSSLTTLLTDYETSTVRGYNTSPGGGQVISPILAGASPANVVIAPNGRLAFTGNVNGSYISVVDLTIQAEIARIRDVNGSSIAITSDGQKLVSVGYNRDELDIIDIATFAVTRISLDGKVGDVVGKSDIHAFSLALAGYRAYIANEFGPVIVVDFASLFFSVPSPATISTVAGTAAFAPLQLHAGHQVAATPDGSTVAVIGRPVGSTTAFAYVISTSTNTLSPTVPTNPVPTTFGGPRTTIAITPNPNAASGVVAFLGGRAPGNPGSIAALDLRNGSATYGQLLAGSVALGSQVTDMALTPDGATLQAVDGVFRGSTGPPSTLYTLNAALIVTSPSTALVSTVAIPNSLSVRGLAIGYVQNFPLPSAPQVSDVVPQEITNEAAKLVRIFGDNFTPGALVRIGNLDPLPSTFVSPQEVTVTVPAGAAVQLGGIVVTLPNSAGGALAANVSGGGSLTGRTLQIDPPLTFAPSHPVALSGFGVPKLSLLFRDSALLPGGPFSFGIAISPDGLYAYSGLAEVDITNLDSQQSLAPVLGPTSGSGTQTFYDCAGGSDNYAIAPDPTTGKKVLYLVSCDAATETSDTLYMVDVDPTSTTTRNTLLPRTIQVPNTDFFYSQGLAVTPDGRFVYSVDARNVSPAVSRLVIFDVLNGTSTTIPDITTLGADPAQQHIHVTPDGHSLLLGGIGGASIKVYDIQGANALAPVLVTTITGSGAPTANPPLLYWFQVVGTRLFAYASDQRYVQVFNFDRTTPNFAPLGSYVIPSAPGTFAGAPMAVTPEGSLLYAVVENEDAVAVLDANLVAASSPNSLITKMGTLVNPANLAISTRTNATADIQACTPASTVTTCVTTDTMAATINQEAFVGFTVRNGGPSTATGVTFTATLPAGVTLNAANAFPDGVSGTNLPIACTGTTTVVCNLPSLRVYDSAQQIPQVLVILGVTPTTSLPVGITGTVSANESANKSASITLSAGADLQVIPGLPTPDPVTVGAQVTYTITVTNNGPQAATNVSAVFASPVPVVSVTLSQGSCVSISCALGPINSGASATITVVGTITAQAAASAVNGAISSTVVVFDAGTSDPNLTDNVASVVTHIVSGATATEYLFTGDTAAGQLNVVDLTTNANPFTCINTGDPIATGCMPGGTWPDDILISPNRHLAFVSHQAPYVSVVDLTIKREVQRIWTLGSTVHRIAMTPDGSMLLIPDIGSDTLAVVDLTQFPFQVSQRINLNGVGGNPALPAGRLSVGDLIVVGNKVYIAFENGPNYDGNPALNMVVVNLATNAVGTVANTNGGKGYFGGKNMAATPDGSTLIVAQQSSDVNCVVPDQLLRISTGTDALTNTLPLPVSCGTHAVAPSTSSSLVYIKGYDANFVDTVYQVNLASGLALGNSVALPRAGTRTVINSAGTKLYVTANNVQTGTTFIPNVMVVDTGLLASNPASAVTAQFRSAMTMQAASIGFADLLPEPGAPTVSSVDPLIMFNDTPTTVSVFGSGFAAGATVKIGNLDPIVATPISANQLQVTVPAGVASQEGEVIVTNPNPGAALQSQVVSGLLPVCGQCTFSAFQIINPVTFQPHYEVDAVTFGDSNISILHQDRRDKGQTFLVPFNLYWPQGLVFSNDGSLMYVPAVTFNNPNSATSTLDIAAIGTGNNGQQSTTPVPGLFGGLVTIGGQTIATAPSPATGQQVVYYAARAPNSLGGFDRLNFLDANLSSPAANTFVDAMVDTTTALASGSSVVTGPLASTPDGRYVYSAANANLVIYDTLQRTVTSFNATAAGVGNINPVVAPDGRFLLLPSTTGQIMVFDISATPQAPSLLQTITSFTPNGMNLPFFNSYVLDCRDGCGFGFLYAYDESQNLVEAFSLGSYSFVNYFVVPGHHGIGNGTVAVTPDGARLYAALYGEDTVAVLDANQLVTTVAQNDPTVLVTKMATGLGPTTLAVNPRPLDTAPADVGVTLSHAPSSVLLGDSITYTVTISNSSNYDAQGGGVVIDLDPSLTLTYATFYDPNWIFKGDVPCTGTTHIVCDLGGKNNNCSGNNCGGGGLPANFSTTVTVIAKTNSAVPITTKALIASNSFDPNTANNVATDTANVVAAVGPPVIIKAFGAASIPLNGSTSLSFTIQNNNTATTLTGVGFSDAMPGGLVISTPNGLTGTCGGGTITATSGSSVMSLTGATLAQSSSCTFSVNVTGVMGSVAGTQINTTGNVSSTEGGTGGTASASIDVVVPPSIAKAFNPATIALNGTTSLTFTITNPAANVVAETGVAYTDTLPAGLVVATPNGLTSTCGGTATAVAGSGSISLTGGTIAASSTCTITANVTGTALGNYTNTIGGVSSTNGGTGNPATANLSVATPPTIAKTFGAASIPLNGSTSLTFTITNPAANTIALTGVAFTDNLPAGLVVATPNGLASTCGGTATAVAGASSLSLAGATLAANTSCAMSVNVTGTTAGVKNNSVQVTSTESGAGNTSNASVTVVAADLGVTMTAFPTIVVPGSNLTYTITVTNNGPSASTGYTLTDTLPSNVNFVSATAGCVLSTVLTCSGSSLGAGLTATYVVVVTPTTQAALTNTASVTGNEPDPVPGNNSAASATADIAVTVAGAPSLVGGQLAYSATVKNNGPADATNVVLTDVLDNFGFVSAASTQGSCTYSAPTVTCSPGALANGTGAVVTVVVTVPNAGWAANTFHASAAQPDQDPTNNSVRLGPSLDSFNTPVGSNVAINASDPADNLIASLTFSNVTRVGSTTVTPMSAASLPAGFRSGRQPTFFDISTNAEFVGAIALNIHFLPANFRHPALVRLFHFEGGTWVDRTTGLIVSSGVIAGQVMSLSPFALLEPVDTIPVANAGADRSVPGAMAAGARVTLDGSASVDADGDPLTYRWSGPFPEGGGTVTGISPTVTLPLGVSKVALVVNDGEADSPAVAANVAVADFQVSAPAGSVALNRGQSTTFTITMTPQYGAFGAPINLSCAPGAADVTCSFSSASVTPGTTATTATLTVTAAATVARAPGRSMPASIALWLGTLPAFGVVFLAAGRRKKWQILVLLMLLLVLVASHIGCGGGGTTQTQSSSSSTPGAKAVAITVTGTSGTLQHSSSVTVTIPQ